ncbi:HAD-IA family hydrolase [Streptomyces sp. NPDC051173]|uniref:HAD-IA family hydrolase n=1 Tax=Streptomyces sp. NPDC051173 TaxID=3155164 RepID=UPI00344C7C5D
MPTIDGLLLDMNGLFRHWRNTGAQTSEQRAGLPVGAIARYAYSHPSYRLARVGVLTDQQWADDVAERLAKDYGAAVREHLAAWRSDRGESDPAMVEVLRQLRGHVPVGVLSNCTDALPADLEHHDIEFDFVFASAHLGVDKPSPLAFRAAAEGMGLPPTKLGYFDDEPTFVAAAQATGLHAHLFKGVADFVAELSHFGLPIKFEKHSNQ